MQEFIEPVQQTSKLISEMGILVTIAAFFLIGTAVLFISLIKTMKQDREEFKRLYSELTTYVTKKVDELISATLKQNSMLNVISERLKPETRERLRAIIDAYFDLASEKALQILKRVKRENGIANKKATHEKFIRLLTNLHKKRKLDFTHFTWMGEPIATATDPQWISQVADVLEYELYHPEENESRTYTNIKNTYDAIRNDYYERLGLE